VGEDGRASPSICSLNRMPGPVLASTLASVALRTSRPQVAPKQKNKNGRLCEAPHTGHAGDMRMQRNHRSAKKDDMICAE
jgi:hypothetical protein